MLLFLQLLYTKDFQVSYNLAKDKTTVWEILIYINNKIREYSVLWCDALFQMWGLRCLINMTVS